MVAGYAPDVTFSDPVFPALRGDEARGMWRMLCARGKDLRLEFSAVEADDRTGSAHWEAWYTFTGTGRQVHNIIDASFTFSNGLITSHVDRFDLYRWSRQALGPIGMLLGWTPLVQNKIRGTAARALGAYLRPKSQAS
jgi:hypothetical protein